MSSKQHSIADHCEDEDFDVLVCDAIEDINDDFDVEHPRTITLPRSAQSNNQIRDREFSKSFSWTAWPKAKNRLPRRYRLAVGRGEECAPE